MPLPNTEFENKLASSDFGKMVELPGIGNPTPKPPAEMSIDELSSSLKGQADLFLGKALPNPYTPQKISPLQIDQSGRYNKQLVGWDNEDIYGSMQSNWDKAANGVLKGLELASTTFLQGTVGLIYGLGQVAATGEVNKFYNNDLTQTLDKWNKEAENALPNYYTAKETNAEWYSPDNLFTANFLWDKLIKNVGFSIGALYSGGVVSKGISGLMKGVGLLTEASAAAKVASALEEVLPSVPQAARLSKFQEILQSSLPKLTAQQVDRSITSLFGASTEAGIEALQGLNEFRDAKLQEFQAKNFRAPNDEEMRAINDSASSLGNARFFMNIGLLSATNYIQLPKILGSRYATSKAIANTEAAATRRTATGALIEDIERAMPTSKLGRLRSATGHVGGLFLSASEGFEEGAQYVIQEGVNDYYSKKYGGDGATFLDSLVQGASQLGKKEGMESIILGSLSGGMQQAGFHTFGRTGKLAERGFTGTGGKRAADTAQQVADINGTSLKWFSDMKDAAARGINLMKEQEAYIRQGDILETKDKEQDLMHNYLAARIKNGRYDLVKEDIATLRQAASTPQGLERLVTEGYADPNDTQATFQARLNNFEKHADLLKPTYEALNLKYGGLYTTAPDGTKKRTYADDVIDKMAYAVSKVGDYDTRIPELSRELLSNGIDIQAAIGEKVAGTAQDEATDPSKQIDALIGKNVDQKAALKTALEDVLEMTKRRQYFLGEYDRMAVAPATYEEPSEEPTKEPEEGELPAESIEITTKKGPTKVDIGTEYMLGDVEEKGPNGTTIYRHPTLTILGENEDGTIKIKDGNGQVRDVSKDVLSKYKLSKAADVLGNKTANYFRLHRNTVFEYNFGKKSKEGKRPGRLTYEFSNGENKLFFKYVSHDGTTKSIRLFNEHFVAQKDFKNPRIKALYDLQAQTPEQKQAEEDFKAQKEEAGMTAKRDARLEIISELKDETEKSLEQTRKKIADKAEQLDKINEELETIKTKAEKTALPRTKREKAMENKYPHLSASSTRFSKILKTVPKAISRLTALKEDVEHEIAKLTAEQEELEFNLEYIEDFAQNIDELPQDSQEFLKEIKEQAGWIEETIKETASNISTLGKIAKSLEEAIIDLAHFLKSAFTKFDADYPQYIKDGFDRIIAGGTIVAEVAQVKEYLADYTLLEDTKKEIKTNEHQLEEAQREIDETYASLLDLAKQLSAKQAIVAKFQKVVDAFKAKEAAEAEALKDLELQKKFFYKQKKSQQESGVATPSPEDIQAEDVASLEKREAARKPSSILFNATTTPSVLTRESDIRHQNFLSRLDFFPNASNIKRTYVTENNEIPMGLSGLLQKHLGDDFEKYRGDAILAIYVEVSPEGHFFVDEYGKRLVKVGEQIIQDLLVYAAMPTTSLEDSYGKRYAGDNEEEAKAWQKVWEQKRTELLSYTKEYLAPEDFYISRGIPEKTDKKEYIVGTLVSEQQLKDNKPVLVVSTLGKIEHQGKSVTIPVGRVMVQNGSFLEYANNRNLTDQEAEASFNVLKEFVRKANDTKTFDNKLLKFLQGILYFQSPYITEGEESHKNPVARNQFYFHQGNLFFGEKEFAVPFTSASMEANKDTVMAFLKGSYNHINNKFLTDPILRSQPFIEYTGNLEEKEWANYQTYLLSTEGRKAGEVPLSTNIRAKDPLVPDDRNFNNKYSYSNLLKQEDIDYKKPEPEEAVTEEAPPFEVGDEVDTSGMTEWEKTMAVLQANMKSPEKGEEAQPSKGFKLENFLEGEEEKGEKKGKNKIIPLAALFGTPKQEEGEKDEFQKMLDEQAGKTAAPDESQFRIAIPVHGYTIANVEEEEAYIKANSPFSVQTVKNLVDAGNGAALWGAYRNAIIYLDEAMEIGTGYHELFEGIFDVFLNNAEKKRIYREFINRKGGFIDRATGVLTEYQVATPHQAKEQMAEEFRDMKLYGELPSQIDSNTSPILKFFEDLLRWIRSFFTGEIKNLDDLFERMDSAYYKNVAFKNAPTQILQAREKVGEFTPLETDTVIRAVVSSVFQNIFQEGKTQLINDLDFEGKVPVEVYGKIKEQLQYYYLQRKDAEGKLLPNTAYKEMKEQGLDDTKIDKFLKPIALSLFKNWDQIIKYSGELLKTFKILQEQGLIDKEDEEAEIEGRDSYFGNEFQYDGKKNAPASIKLLIATLQESAFVSTSGTIIPGQVPSMKKVTVVRDASTRMQRMVDYAQTFNALLDALSSLNTLEEKEAKVRELADVHPEYVRLFTRLRAGNDSISMQDWALRVKFYNTFAKQHPLALNTYLRPDGTSSIGAADLDSSVKQLSNSWLSGLKASPAVTYKEGKYLINMEYKEGGKPMYPTDLSSPSSRLKYLAKLGIKFTPKQVNNLTKQQEASLSKATVSLRGQLTGKEVNITSLYTLKASAPLEEIFKIYLQTENRVPNSVFSGLDGNYRQTFVQTNAVSRMANDLNNTKSLAELFEELPHLQDEYSADSYYLNNRYGEEGLIGHDFLIKYIQGIVAPDGKKNTPTDKLSRSKKLMQGINQNLNENYYLLIPADGKTEWMMGMKNPFLSLSGAALEQFYAYYQNEQALGGSANRIFSFLKDGLSKDQFTEQFTSFIEGEVAAQFKELLDYNIITNTTKGKYKWDGLDSSYIEANKLNHNKMSLEEINNILLYRTVNYVFNNIEQHKLFFGDPKFYSDFKRYKSFLSPREQALYNSPKFDAQANKEFNDVNGQLLKKGDPGYQVYKDFLKTVTQEDIISINDLPGYKDIKGTDAQAFTHPAAYKQMRFKTGRWSSADEKQIQFINAEDRLLMEEDGLYKYSSQILKKRDQQLIADKDPHTSTFSPLKPIVAGFDVEGPVLDKYSIAMLSYRMVRKSNMAKQYKRMLDNEIDYTIYKSGRKVGARKEDSIYNSDGTPNTAPYSSDAILNVPFKWWGIQVETQGDKFSQTWGSQLGKLATMNLLNGGVPIDYKGSFAEWIALVGEEAKMEASPIYKLVSHERSVREAMIEGGYQQLLDAVGINKDGTVSKKKLLDLIKDELTRRELNDNIKDALRLTDDGEFYIPIEALNNYEQIKNIIFSYVDKYISRPKVGGGAKIQVSGAGMEVAGQRIVASMNKKGKVTYTSAGLKFYTKEEKWMEIMVPNWFADKIRKIPALNGLSDEEIIKKINEGPDGQEILSGIGFRIPTQELNSVENFRIKAFLPAYLGDMIVVPEEITKKSGGDFDVDKLNTYLKNVYVNGKGQLALVPFQGLGEGGLEAFRELIAKEQFQKLVAITPLDKFNAKVKPVEEKPLSQKEIEANIESLNTGELRPKEIEEAQDAEELANIMYRQSLQNEYYRTVEKLLTLEENFDHLISPNNSDELMELRDMLAGLVPQEFSQGAIRSVISPMFMNNLRHMFAEGKGGVGIAASAQVQNAVAQKSAIVIDPGKISGLKDRNEKNYIKDASIRLPHNQLELNGKKMSTISMVKDKAGRYISTKISQFINGFVDIANDPFLVQIGVNNNNAGTYLLLERLGVPTDTTVLFMNQPIIREYQKSLEKIGMSYPYIQDNIDAILSDEKFRTKGKIPAEFPKSLNSSLTSNINDFYNGKLTEEQKAFQHFVLNEYLKYSVIASNLFRLSQATNYDTARFTNPYLYLRKLVKTKDAKTNNVFSSPDIILKSTFVGILGEKVGDATKKISDSFFKFLKTDIQPYVFPTIYKLAERKKMNDIEFVKAARKVEQSFMTYLIQNTGERLNTRLHELLVEETTSLATQLQKAKTRLEALPSNPFPIISRFIAENIQNPTATKTIRMFDKGTDVFSQNTLIAAMQELKDNPKTMELYKKLIRVAFLQSGTGQSPISFLDIVPVEDFKAFVFPALKGLYDPALLRGFQQTRSFFKNSWRDPLVVPRIEVKFVENEYSYFDEFGSFSSREIKNQYSSPSLTKYAKAKGINNFITFKLSQLSNEYSSDFVTVQLGEKNNKTTYLLQRLVDPATGKPFTLPYNVKYPDNRYGIYYQINPLGDGYKAQEHYQDNRRTVLEGTEAASIPVELSPTEIINAIGGKDLFIPDNVVSLPKGQQMTGQVLGTIKANLIKDLIFSGKAITTIRNDSYHKQFYKGDGVYTIENNGKQVEIKYQGVATKLKDGIQIAHPNGDVTSISLDEFGKDEGFDNWKGFLKNQQYSDNFISGEKTRHIYSIKPVTSTQTKTGQIDFQEDQNSGYAPRTRKNASADATIAIAVDFDSAGEKLTKSSVEGQSKKYIPIDIKKELVVDEDIVDNVVAELNYLPNTDISLNIAGNGIYTMKGKYTQEELDEYVHSLLKAVIADPNFTKNIVSIRTGGQTGLDEAGAKAGIKLGIPTIILAPKGWGFRDITGKDIYNQAKFKARFGQNTPQTMNIYAGTNENAVLSNFATRPFVLNGGQFNSVEQFYQESKLAFTDKKNLDFNTKLHKQIAESNNQFDIKRLGGQFKGLDVAKWNAANSNIMKMGLKASFEQNPKALQALLATGNATLTHTQDTGKWKTEFPKLLMEVRKELGFDKFKDNLDSQCD